MDGIVKKDNFIVKIRISSDTESESCLFHYTIREDWSFSQYMIKCQLIVYDEVLVVVIFNSYRQLADATCHYKTSSGKLADTVRNH
jgi:hypothetical protein